MKRITFNVNDFAPVINKALGIITGGASLNILNDLFIRSKNGEYAIIRASDGDAWITQKAALVKQEDFEEVCFAVNAKDFASVLNTLSGNVVTIVIDEETSTLIGSYGNGEFQLPFDDASVYPSPVGGGDEWNRLNISADKILSAIDNVKFATSNSEVHKVLNGIRFNILDSGIETSATDLVMISVYHDTTVDTNDSRGGFTLPTKAANLLSKMLRDIQDDVTISYNDRVVMFENELFKIVSRLQDGNFPACRKVIKRTSKISVTVCRKDILNALRRVLPMSDTASQVVKFAFTDELLTISSEDVLFSKAAKEKVKCDYKGEPFVIGLKGTLIQTMLSVVGYENIVINLEEPSVPAIITPETNEEGVEHTMLLAPIQLFSNV